MADTTINILSLCTGGGGLDLGVELAIPNARVVCGVEWDAFAVEYLASLMQAGCMAPFPVWSNLKTFDGAAWRGCVDILTAGYPCQPFSLAGKRGGADDPRHLWPDVARVIREAEPDIVFLENVAGHLSLGGREVFAELHGMGYATAGGLFTASEVGAPHKRDRLFMLAHRRSVELEQHCELDGGTQAHSANGHSCREHVGGCDSTLDRPADRRPAIEESGSESRRRSGELVDSTRHEYGPESGGRRVRQAIPLFPPRPTDLDRWREVLAIDPELSPATQSDLRVLAHGVDRSDRRHLLRLAGNGVCPLQAAFAFLSLWADLT